MDKLNGGWLKRIFTSHKGFVSVILLGIAGVATFVPILTYLYFAKDLNAQEKILNRNSTGVILVDRNNKPFFKFYQAHFQNYTPIGNISKYLQEAVIAAEDREFYHHSGFSLKGIAGAILADTKKGDLSYGGSTITQQLVKISLLNSKKDIFRKYQEVILSQELERRYQKDQILEMYLNSVYFGEGAFGAEQAARVYFDKPAAKLDLAEASMLAAVLPAPTKLSPLSGDLEKTKKRQEYVLQEMVEQGYINPSQKDQALAERFEFKTNKELFSFDAPHFALLVKQQLVDKYGEETVARSGFRVKTSLDLDYQRYAEKVVQNQVASLKGNNVSNGAAIAMDPKTGEILAMVGSRDWNNEQFGKVNITTAERQPGSAFKPIVYAAGLEEELITPATILKDEPVAFPEDNDYSSWSYKQGKNLYKPRNYDGKFRGPVTVRRALVNSLNVPAVEVLSKVGIPNAVEMGERLGLSTLEDPKNYGLSLTLGSAEVKLLELTEVYGAFANQGVRNEPTTILEIVDKSGDKVYEFEPKGQKVLEPEVAFQISSILSDNKTRSEIFGNSLNISRTAAVKTGTTENYRDAWTFGYTPSLVVGSWVGNNDGQKMDQVAGSLGAAPIWKNLMENYLENTPKEEFIPPENIVKVITCNTIVKNTPSPSNKPDQENKEPPKSEVITVTTTEYFIKGTEPSRSCKGVEFSPNPQPIPSLTPTPTPISTPDPTPENKQSFDNNDDAFGYFFGGPSEEISPLPIAPEEPSPTPIENKKENRKKQDEDLIEN